MRKIAAARSTEGVSRERKSGWTDEGTNRGGPWKLSAVMDAADTFQNLRHNNSSD